MIFIVGIGIIIVIFIGSKLFVLNFVNLGDIIVFIIYMI